MRQSLAITQSHEASGAESAVKVRRPRDSGGGAQRSTLYGAEHRGMLTGVMTTTIRYWDCDRAHARCAVAFCLPCA